MSSPWRSCYGYCVLTATSMRFMKFICIFALAIFSRVVWFMIPRAIRRGGTQEKVKGEWSTHCMYVATSAVFISFLSLCGFFPQSLVSPSFALWAISYGEKLVCLYSYSTYVGRVDADF